MKWIYRIMNWFVKAKHEEFSELYEKIKEKHMRNIKEIGKRERHYFNRKVVFIILIIILFLSMYGFIGKNVDLPNELCFFALVLLIAFALIDRITITEDSEVVPIFYDYYCENIIPDILKSIAKDINRDGNIESWMPNEVTKNFKRFGYPERISTSYNYSTKKNNLSDRYVFRNHYFGERDGTKIEMFDMIQRYVKYPGLRKFHLGFPEYIYSSSTINNNIKVPIKFTSLNIKKLKNIDKRLYEIVKEFQYYRIRYRVVVFENKLMILVKNGMFPYLFSEKVMRRHFLYKRYLTYDFIINFTTKLNEYFRYYM